VRKIRQQTSTSSSVSPQQNAVAMKGRAVIVSVVRGGDGEGHSCKYDGQRRWREAHQAY